MTRRREPGPLVRCAQGCAASSWWQRTRGQVCGLPVVLKHKLSQMVAVVGALRAELRCLRVILSVRNAGPLALWSCAGHVFPAGLWFSGRGGLCRDGRDCSVKDRQHSGPGEGERAACGRSGATQLTWQQGRFSVKVTFCKAAEVRESEWPVFPYKGTEDEHRGLRPLRLVRGWPGEGRKQVFCDLMWARGALVTEAVSVRVIASLLQEAAP